MTDWTHAWAHVGTSVLAAFLGSLVEFVEAMTILLAVGTVRGWRSAWTGAAAGVAVLTVLVVALGPALERIPVTLLQLVVGALLLVIGTRWLWKAVLRAAGIMRLRDEDAVCATATAALEGRAQQPSPAHLDLVAIATAFKAVILEGLEVVLIVIAAGAVTHTLGAASLGAALAGVLVLLAGAALRRPLARVPENTLKFAVGVLLSAFGTFWVGEGLGVRWPAADLALVGLAAGFWAVAMLGVAVARRTAARP
jgi:uncharacterized membrane protein